MVSYVMSYWNKNCPRVVPLPHPRCRRKILQKSQLGCCQQRNAPASPNPRVLSVGSGNGRDPRPKMFTFCGTTILILSKLSRGDNICQPGKSTPETWQDSCSVCHDFGGPHPSLLSLGLTLTEKTAELCIRRNASKPRARPGSRGVKGCCEHLPGCPVALCERAAPADGPKAPLVQAERDGSTEP